MRTGGRENAPPSPALALFVEISHILLFRLLAPPWPNEEPHRHSRPIRSLLLLNVVPVGGGIFAQKGGGVEEESDCTFPLVLPSTLLPTQCSKACTNSR